MGILLTKDTQVIVQGITGHHGTIHARLMREYGTHIVAGVTPGKGGQDIEGIPVYDTVKKALRKHRAQWSVIFVPSAHAKDAALEALQAGLHIVIITEHVPVHDAIEIHAKARRRKRVVLGPNCPGLVVPGACKIGIMPNDIFLPGDVGVVSRSGTLTYEIVHALTKNGVGQSAVVGCGGDPVPGMDFIDVLKRFEKDKATRRIVIIGEIGGDFEERAAAYIKEHVSKPVVAYIAGRTAPADKHMGHAGAIISGKAGTAAMKIRALREAGAGIARFPSDVTHLL